MATFHFHLVAPDKMTFTGEVDQVDIPGTEGDFGVLAGHAPTVALLRPGILVVHAGGQKTEMVVLGGFAEVSESGLTVLADVADKAADMDRGVVTGKIEQLEAGIKDMGPGNALDKAIARLDHFKSVDRHLSGTAMH
jgi:F-type H+-transporting ATPase subunit epsilon